VRAAVLVPNALTLARAVGAIAAWRAARRGNLRRANTLLGLSATTDVLDGYAARRLGAVTATGAALDPTADRALIAAAIYVLAKSKSCSRNLLGLIALREATLVVVVLGTVDTPPTRRGVTTSGKLATTLALSGTAVCLQGRLRGSARLHRIGNVVLGASLPFGYLSLASHANRRLGRR